MKPKCLLVVTTLFFAMHARAVEIQVAVASNFTAPIKQIAVEFEKETGTKLQLAFGSTGKFYSQIKNGAPFEVLLSADHTTPTKLAQEGLAVASSQFTYAKGKLVLWSAKPATVDDNAEILKKSNFKHIAIANPKLAPYGAAAIEVMQSLAVHDALMAKIVTGESIGQAFQFVKSGNAQLGFVALSQVLKDSKISEGSAWIVPAKLHKPIKQDAVILSKGKGKPEVEALMEFLKGDKVRKIILFYGYDL